MLKLSNMKFKSFSMWGFHVHACAMYTSQGIAGINTSVEVYNSYVRRVR